MKQSPGNADPTAAACLPASGFGKTVLHRFIHSDTAERRTEGLDDDIWLIFQCVDNREGIASQDRPLQCQKNPSLALNAGHLIRIARTVVNRSLIRSPASGSRRIFSGPSCKSQRHIARRRDRRSGRVVEGTGLENRQAGDRLVGSNPTSSATSHGVYSCHMVYI